jgi:uncharacterized phage protein (TIGR02218 family)
MKKLSTDFKNTLAQEVTTFCYLWLVIRKDGQKFGFTNHDKDLWYKESNLPYFKYEASSGFMPSALSTESGLSVDDIELECVLRSDAITQADLLAGLWDRAEVFLYQVDYSLATNGIYLDETERNLLRRGWLGEVKLGTNSFVVELRGLTQSLNQQIGQKYGPSCRATFGDSRCRLNLESFKASGSITALVDAKRIFTDSTRIEAENYFANGYLSFSSGPNAGVSREVQQFADGMITCELPFPFSAEVGDTYDIYRGCDKRLETCRDAYNNVVNFRGEPFIPIVDKLIQGPQ